MNRNKRMQTLKSFSMAEQEGPIAVWDSVLTALEAGNKMSSAAIPLSVSSMLESIGKVDWPPHESAFDEWLFIRRLSSVETQKNWKCLSIKADEDWRLP